jgi:hypothetical protein
MGCIRRRPNDTGVTITDWFLPFIPCRYVVIHYPSINHDSNFHPMLSLCCAFHKGENGELWVGGYEAAV